MSEQKKATDDTAYDIDAIVQAFADLLTHVNAMDIQSKTHHLKGKPKVIWLHEVDVKGKGCFNLVFKSAKYDQSRTVRNTETMEDLGVLKNKEDGDEEKTHLLIRFRTDSNRFIAAIESNYYGVTVGDIVAYLNEYFNRQTVDITIHKKRGKNNNIPKDLIRDVYKNTGGQQTIKRIAVEGTNPAGSLKIDSESYQMKHSIMVDTAQNHEINTIDFFQKAGEYFREMGL